MKNILLIILLGLISSLYAQWNISTDIDKMTGDKSSYAVNDWHVPTERMAFPYHDVSATVAIGCNKSDTWMYLAFSESPNLSNTETKNKYSLIESRIKFDDKVENTTLTQDWGSKFIHFLDRKDAINKLRKSKKLLVELDWYGNGLTYFEFNLDGADEAINSIYNSCGYNNKTTEIVNKAKKEITLKSKTLVEQKKECLEVGGKYGWDLKKDIFRCNSK